MRLEYSDPIATSSLPIAISLLFFSYTKSNCNKQLQASLLRLTAAMMLVHQTLPRPATLIWCHRLDSAGRPPPDPSIQPEPSNHTSYIAVDSPRQEAADTPQAEPNPIEFDDIKALRLEDFFEQPEAAATDDDDEDEQTRVSNKASRQLDDDHDDDDGFFASYPGAAADRLASQSSQIQTGTNRSGTEHQRATSRTQGERPTAAAAAASSQHGGRASAASSPLANTCALPSAGGRCLTYGMVEWAIGQAKRSLGWTGQAGAGAGAEADDLDGQQSGEPSESAVHAAGELNEQTVRVLALQFGLTADQVAQELGQVDVRLTSLWRACPRLYRRPMARSCLGGSPYSPAGRRRALLLAQRFRSHTGQCNNPLEPRLGASYMPFVRLAPPHYADGVGLPRRAASGNQLPPVRLVALTMHQHQPDELPNDSADLSMLFVNWGQLINHDLAQASNARPSTGHQGHCCRRRPFAGLGKQVATTTTTSSAAAAAANLLASWRDPSWRVCMPIQLAAHDPVYAPYALTCHEFKRSLAGLRPGCSLGPRTQLNTITSFVDASFVYGSTRAASLAVRRGGPALRRAGQLATWNYFAGGQGRAPGWPLPLKPLLPADESGAGECLGGTARSPNWRCFLSGDSRTNQQVPLATLHTLHTRQHNRLAQGLAQVNPHWPGARLYEEARRLHIALVQHILLAEYLPLLLGAEACRLYNLTEAPPGEHWDHYEPAVNPGISQEFAAAAFRQGHSSVPRLVYRVDPWTRQLRRAYSLRQTFRQPWALFEPGAVDEFLVGLTEAPAQANDPFLNQELSGHLLEEPGDPVGLDLASINLQRGRDQGLPDYMSMRQWCGLETFDDFAGLASQAVMPNETSQLLAQLYESPWDIDLFTGGLGEFALTGAQVGPTFACIIGHQFRQLRAGDRFWFEASLGGHGFAPDQLASIKQVSLARLLCANSDRVALIQPQALRLAHPVLNPLQACDELPDLDLGLWAEAAPVAGAAQPPSGPAATWEEAEEEDDDDGEGS